MGQMYLFLLIFSAFGVPVGNHFVFLLYIFSEGSGFRLGYCIADRFLYGSRVEKGLQDGSVMFRKHSKYLCVGNVALFYKTSGFVDFRFTFGSHFERFW